MAELSKITKQMQSMLPQWMKMARDPNSVGAQFLNVFGLELEDVQTYLDEVLGNMFIGTANVSQIDIAYKVPLALPTIFDQEGPHTITGKKNDVEYTITMVDTLRDFYSASATENVCMLDRSEGILYVRPQDSLMRSDVQKPFDEIIINGAPHYNLILHHVWNPFDEFGLLLGIYRMHGERNDAFKERILDVFRRPGNASKEGIINALSRELGIDAKQIQVHDLSDPAFVNTLIDENGVPTPQMRYYVENMNKVLGFTWDHMVWGDAYWRSIEEENMGLHYLPHIWDARMLSWSDEDFQSGVGDGDDLLVLAPTENTNQRSFKAYVGLRGYKREKNPIYPEHSFKYKIVAKGTIRKEVNKMQNYKYTVVASEVIPLYFIVRAFKQYIQDSVIDFSGLLSDYKFDSDTDPSIEVIDRNQMQSIPTDQYVEVEVSLETKNQAITPQLHDITIEWKDSTNAINTLTLSTESDFIQNNETIATTLTNISTSNGNIELGYGTFFYEIDEVDAWKNGTSTNIVITDTGSISLKRTT